MKNSFQILGDTTLIHCTYKEQPMTVQINTEDLELVQSYQKWWLQKKDHTFYAYAFKQGNKGKVYMHRLINNTPKGLLTDHRDFDGMNNKRDNLRTVTNKQNQNNRRDQVNRERYIYFQKDKNKYRVRVEKVQVGYAKTIEEAIKLRDDYLKV